MKKLNLATATVPELADEFLRLAIAKGRAVMDFEISKANRIYLQIDAVRNELKNRPGDQRRVLAAFYRHPSPSVRLEAATATLVVLPEQSRMVLQEIVDRLEFPFAGTAGMRLHNLETGFYKPT
ncbi:MAG: hypothetical protein JWP21_2247 [Tardiphaga sp.]|nr:hypothetical protein [Tardiphaga sp.]